MQVDRQRIAEFCRRWKVEELSLFGSVLRENFRPNSDVDVLVSFAPDVDLDIDDWLSMIEELKIIFDRDVDLVDKSGLRNPFRRHAILSAREVLYAA